MKELILATSNHGKIKELQAMLAPIKCIPQQTLEIPDADETGLSFVENAILKARHASKLSGKAALADDSGLVVLALNGEPGIYSARFSGDKATDETNIHALLEKLNDVPDYNRQAFFYCAIALVEHENDPTPVIATGRLEGKITSTLSGTKGFGYDPIFYVPEYDATLAELGPEIKNEISHRARALKQLLSKMLE
jgi:XTP/dITP diphosphohydrolase